MLGNPYDPVQNAHLFFAVLTLAKDTPDFNFERFSKLLVKPLQVFTSAKSCEIVTMYYKGQSTLCMPEAAGATDSSLKAELGETVCVRLFPQEPGIPGPVDAALEVGHPVFGCP